MLWKGVRLALGWELARDEGSRLGNGTEREMFLQKEKSEEEEGCIFSVEGLVNFFCFCHKRDHVCSS